MDVNVSVYMRVSVHACVPACLPFVCISAAVCIESQAHVLSVGLLLRLFHLLYNCDVVEEEVYHSWKEDIAQDFPGKEKALFQVGEDREVVTERVRWWG